MFADGKYDMKYLFSIMLLAIFTLFTCVPTAYAAEKTDAVTKVSFDDSTGFMMELKSNELVLSNAPVESYDRRCVYISVYNAQSTGNSYEKQKRLACSTENSNGVILDVSNLPDDTYDFEFGYCDGVTPVEYGLDGYGLPDYLPTQEDALWSKTIRDLNSDGVAETYTTYIIHSLEKNDDTYVGTVDTDVHRANDINISHYVNLNVKLAIKNGKASFKLSDRYANNLEYISQERTDEAALDNNKQIDKTAFSDDYIAYLNTQAESIIAGKTSDYEKVKAIHKWVAENLWYAESRPHGTVVSSWNYFKPNAPLCEDMELVAGDATVCGGYSTFAMNLLRAAGFPAKEIHGTVNEGHSWVEVWVDNRWLFMDPTWDSMNFLQNGKFTKQTPSKDTYFDLPVYIYSFQHKIDVEYMLQQDSMTKSKERYLSFISTGNNVLKTVTDFTVGGLLTSTYGFEAEDLYWDWECKKPVNLATDRIDSLCPVIYVKNPSKTYTITFDSCGGTPIDAVTVSTREDNNYEVMLPNIINPTRKGYTFVGWSNIKPTRALRYDEEQKDGFGVEYGDGDEAIWWLVDLADDTVNKSATYYAAWKENSKPTTVSEYKVTYDTNGGNAVKAVTVKANSTIKKPVSPTRKGYKFVGWYKDYNCTKEWNFKTDKVTANTILYADWAKTYTVTFKSNGGTTVKAVVATKNATITKPTNPTRIGYKFVGWYKDSKCTKAWNFTKDKITANTTLYAGWKKI